jgi:hypothetical protein
MSNQRRIMWNGAVRALPREEELRAPARTLSRNRRSINIAQRLLFAALPRSRRTTKSVLERRGRRPLPTPKRFTSVGFRVRRGPVSRARSQPRLAFFRYPKD